jgi:predicted RNA binding protein YcfA (HicA-like mRNA interferase family)
MTYRDVVNLLLKEGLKLSRQTGSHAIYVHEEKEGIVIIAGHPSADVPRDTLNSIKKQAGWK